jgi:Zinc finger, C2H2 type
MVVVNSMTESGIPYNKQKAKQPPDEVGVSPSSNVSETSPEVTPLKVPIIKEPSLGSQPMLMCQICGKAFNTNEELEMHMATNHASMLFPSHV